MRSSPTARIMINEINRFRRRGPRWRVHHRSAHDPIPADDRDFLVFDYHRRAVESDREAFFLRILKPGDYRYEGADLGILVTRGRSITKSFQLNERAKKWIHGIKKSVSGRPLPVAEAGPAMSDPAFKIL